MSADLPLLTLIPGKPLVGGPLVPVLCVDMPTCFYFNYRISEHPDSESSHSTDRQLPRMVLWISLFFVTFLGFREKAGTTSNDPSANVNLKFSDIPFA